jgi:transcriptional regulator with XRE-family HTH domain
MMSAMEIRQGSRRRVVVDDRPLAAAIGRRLRAARLRAGLTQQALAGERYTKAYISALETGVAKPSMAALNYLSERLAMPTSAFVADTETAWTRLDADLRLAQGDFAGALEGYGDLLATGPVAAERAPLLAGMAEALCRVDRGHEAIRPAAEAVATFHDLGRSAERMNAMYWLAYGHHAADNPDEARALMRQVLDDLGAGAPIDSQLRVRALIALGMIEMSAGKSEAAIAYLREADGLAGELDSRRRATFLYALATAYRDAGDHEAAIRSGTQSLALFRSADASVESAAIANLLASAYLEAGSHDQARETASLSRRIADQAGDERLLAHIADTQARIELAADEPATAGRLADEAIELARHSANQRALLDAMVTKARALLELDRAADASELFAEAAELVRTVGPASRRRDVLGAWADALARAGEHARAYEIMREAAQPSR